jgi:preprotein translocase subunit SecA
VEGSVHDTVYFDAHTPTIERLGERLTSMSDSELAAEAHRLAERAQVESLDALLPEAFATTREACERTLELGLTPAQLHAGALMHEGRFVEMPGGSGKSLSLLLPAFLNSLHGPGTHVFVRGELAGMRLVRQMAPPLTLLGGSVGYVGLSAAGKWGQLPSAGGNGQPVYGLLPEPSEVIYGCSVVVAEWNAALADYNRTFTATSGDEAVRPTRGLTLVDDAADQLCAGVRAHTFTDTDVDEGEAERALAEAVHGLRLGPDYLVDQEGRLILTNQGLAALEGVLQQPGSLQGWLLANSHLVQPALTAEFDLERGRDYDVEDGGIVALDPETHEVLRGMGWTGPIGRALEAKEGLQIHREGPMAYGSLWNLVGRYGRAAGAMSPTTTADQPLLESLGLRREDLSGLFPTKLRTHPDAVVPGLAAKFCLTASLAAEAARAGRAVVICAGNEEDLEALSSELDAEAGPHRVLGRYPDDAAWLAERAGGGGSVTLATADVLLNGDYRVTAEVEREGGMLVLGAGRHTHRHQDIAASQIAGRYGAPGDARFIVSLEDDFILRQIGPGMGHVLAELGVPASSPMEGSVVLPAVSVALNRAEMEAVSALRNLIDFDAIRSAPQNEYYVERMQILTGAGTTTELVESLLYPAISAIARRGTETDWSADAHALVGNIFAHRTEEARTRLKGAVEDEARRILLAMVRETLHERMGLVGVEIVDAICRNVYLQIAREAWRLHLARIESLQGHVEQAGSRPFDDGTVRVSVEESYRTFRTDVSESFAGNIFHILFGPISVKVEGEEQGL